MPEDRDDTRTPKRTASGRKRKKNPDLPDGWGLDKPLCARVSQAARQVIEEAASRKGWLPSQLLRVGAVEKATEILNLDGAVDFDFDGLAWDLALRLHESFGAGAADESGGSDKHESPAGSGPSLPLGVPWRALLGMARGRPADFATLIELLEQAAKYGGRGFLEMVIDRCRRLAGERTTEGKAPLDPETLF